VGQGKLIDRDIFAAFAAAEETHWWFAARRTILRGIVDAIAPPAAKGRRVLDIGCGVASTLTAFHPDYARTIRNSSCMWARRRKRRPAWPRWTWCS
jgi:hypothetical protein